MKKTILLAVTAITLAASALPAMAIQCVPYAREVSGIKLKGDAWQWWNAAAGQYERGRDPKDGAVLVFNRQGSMRYGHVSVVTRVINSRLVLVDHANWAPARGTGRGAVTTAVPVVDMSPKNDWTQVRVWFNPASDFGSRVYRTEGFVYHEDTPYTKRPAVHQVALARTMNMFPSLNAKGAAPVEAAAPHVEMAALSTPPAAPAAAPVAEAPVVAKVEQKPEPTSKAMAAKGSRKKDGVTKDQAIAAVQPTATAPVVTAEAETVAKPTGAAVKYSFRSTRSGHQTGLNDLFFN